MDQGFVPGAGNPAELAARSYASYRRCGEKLKALGVSWAAPSFVVPGTVAENCRVLSGLAPEVGLALFETEACLAYGEADLAQDMTELGLTYHVHLPLDLPWSRGVGAVWEAVLGLVEKTAYLEPWGFVLHPPGSIRELGEFAEHWRGHGLDPADLMLENVEGADLGPLYGPSAELGLSLCLDLGHLLAYNQHFPAHARDWERVRLLHVYAPDEVARHRPLPGLDAAGREALREMLDRAPGDAVVLFEVFDLAGCFASAEHLAELVEGWNARD